MSQRRVWIDLVLAFVTATVASLLLWRSLPVADDWGLLEQLFVMRGTGHFVRTAFQAQQVHWSPLWFLLSGACFAPGLPDFGRLPLTLFRIAGLTAFVSAALFILRRGVVGVGTAAMAAVLLAFHQSDVGAFAQWKSIGAIGANAAGAWCAALIIDGLLRNDVSATRRGGGAAVLLLVAALFKETAISYAVFAGLLLVGAMLLPAMRVDGRRVIALTIPVVLATLLFVVARAAAGTPMSWGESGTVDAARYGWGSASEVVSNAAMFALGTTTPISTVHWIDAIRDHAWVLVAMFSAIVVLVNGVIAAGVRWGNRRLLVLSLLGLLSSPIPIVLMKHVSESYLTAAIFWYTLVFAIAFDGWSKGRGREASEGGRQTAEGRGGWRGAAIAVLLLAIGAHVVAFCEKAQLTAASSAAEVRAAWQGIAILRTLPPGTTVAFDLAPPAADHYSSYRVFLAGSAIDYLMHESHIPVHLGAQGTEADYRLLVTPEVVTAIDSRFVIRAR